MNKIKFAAWSGILSLILYVFAFNLELNAIVETLLMFLATITSATFAYGFYLIAQKEKNKRLMKASLILIVLTFVVFLMNTFLPSNYAFEFDEIYFVVESFAGFSLYTLKLFAMGLVVMLFGRALLTLKKYGRIAKWAGILEIICGTSSIVLVVSIFFHLLRNDMLRSMIPDVLQAATTFVALVTLVPAVILSSLGFIVMVISGIFATVLQIILLFKAAKKV